MNTPHTRQVETLIRVTSRLIDVMQREIAFLRTMRIAEIAALQEEKATLVAAYEDGIRHLAADPAALNAVEPALRAELTRLAPRFDGVVAENGRALQAVRDSHRRLVRTIVDAVAESGSRHAAYSASGATPKPPGGRRNARLSLALDQRL